ncbi:HAD-IA family hydrolase [Pannus brasiliensis CCIBt3594]|uniref:HAD-IA family hydrolase n=1 Tax=Pannus brasiliensis CCIBt3594 TaxID=1427578 RepID=A0AAW9QWJ6_9CHRO
MQKPKVILLDAVGTLFGVKGGVGEIYGSIAARHGVHPETKPLDRAFFASFADASPLAFPGVGRERIAELEFQWWYSIARSTFERAGYLERFSDFEAFFDDLYEYFATAEPWFVYDDVRPALQRWQDLGIELGIVSNFDSRIERVLESLELDRFFRTITISSITGAAKPDPKIFRVALEKHDCPVDRAWHIGDSRREDYEGAGAIGLRAFQIDR